MKVDYQKKLTDAIVYAYDTKDAFGAILGVIIEVCKDTELSQQETKDLLEQMVNEL